MPDRDWPPLQRRLARVLRTGMYTAAAVAGAAIVANPPPLAGDVHPVWAVSLSLVAVVMGSVAAVGSAFHRWQVEWVACWFVATAFLGYAIMEAHPSRDYATAFALAAAGLACAARAVDLWVFSLNASRARIARVRAWKRVATTLDGDL